MKTMKVKQGIIGGTAVSVVASLGVGNASESFWGPFLITLGFSLFAVGVVVGLAVMVNRQRAGE